MGKICSIFGQLSQQIYCIEHHSVPVTVPLRQLQAKSFDTSFGLPRAHSNHFIINTQSYQLIQSARPNKVRFLFVKIPDHSIKVHYQKW